MKQFDNIKGLELVNFKLKKGMDDVKEYSDGAKIANLGSGALYDEFEEQYNANHDFAIFQGNNAAVGGLMTLQQKQN